MKKFNCSRKMKRKLAEAYGDTLIRIGKDEMTEQELDDLLKLLITFLDELVGLDVTVVQESLEFLEDKKLQKIETELNNKLRKMREAKK